MLSARIREIIRQFPENGLKLMLEHPANVRDLLRPEGYFGWVLRLVQQRRGRQQEFELLLQRVTHHLSELRAADRSRWLEILSYLEALIYHERAENEQPALHGIVESVGCREREWKEVTNMVRTMADKHREEGAIQAKQETLIRQLRRRFGRLPKAAVRLIEATEDVKRLDNWLDQFAAAESLDDMNITAGT